MLVKKSILGLLNPVSSTNKNYLGSQYASTELIQDIMGEGTFSNADYLLALRKERYDIQKSRYYVNSAKLKELFAELDSANQQLILCAKNTGAWLNVKGTMVTVAVLAAT